MPYPINQRAHQFNSIQSVPVSFGLWDTALKFLSPGPRSDVTDHLDSLQLFFNLLASDECDCEENEECYEGDCYCAEGYDRDEFGKCVSMDNGESFC